MMRTSLLPIAGLVLLSQTLLIETAVGQNNSAPSATAEKSGFDKATLEAYLRHVELLIPQVNIKIDDAKPSTQLPGFFDVVVHLSYNGGGKDEMYFLSQDGKRVLKGDVYDINKSPFQANIDRLNLSQQPSFGPANAPVTLVVFSDFQCPVCKEESNVLRQNVAKTFADKVRVVFLDFPLQTIHPWAYTAAIAGRCVYNQNQAAFWDYFDWSYENQQSIALDNFSTKLQTFASEKKLDGMQLGRCLDNKTTESEVTKEIAQGRSLGVSATPTILVNGRKIEGGLPWQNMEALINLELDHQTQAAKDADKEKCCEVSIPKIVK